MKKQPSGISQEAIELIAKCIHEYVLQQPGQMVSSFAWELYEDAGIAKVIPLKMHAFGQYLGVKGRIRMRLEELGLTVTWKDAVSNQNPRVYEIERGDK